ncbi:grainyhead-like protein 1 homolog isoform X2 [Parasteatoda tepidariorum]|uniref:grainyhead-like protein 1 homolog isoform X2 n=1 Tax=Parasteatoda tepidariorum TaxID=114398 RepID=UPI00077F9A8E|nr:grainyhead-like protein 1 homolog isoform X1 [Parasteatoda tepidariorum]
MVDVLFNSLLKNKELVDELTAACTAPSINRHLDGEDAWKSFREHPLTAATTAMLNIGGSSLQEQNPVGLLYEYYKLEKMDKSLPDFWTVANSVSNSQNSVFSNGNVSSSIPVHLLQSQAADILKNRKFVDELTPQEVELYLRENIVKQEDPNDTEELIVPTSGIVHKSSNIITNSSTDDRLQRPLSPLPMIHVKQESMSDEVKGEPASSVITSHVLAQGYESLAAQFSGNLQYAGQSPNVYMVTSPEYRGLTDYYTEQIRQTNGISAYSDTSNTSTLVDRYIRQVANYKGNLPTLTVDLPSPDSGIGDTMITPRDNSALSHVEVFDYSDLSQTPSILQTDLMPSRPASSSRKSWQEYGRHPELDRIQIPKLYSDVGFRYFLESPISTSQRREDDRITYINKGQFYGITLEYIPDHEKAPKSTTVKSVVMLMFREEKAPDEELKAWQFWHSRQHSVKQRILDADTKNSSGIVGQIDEITHNAIAFYWNPLESPAKVNIAVQCLSTDFSNQKGVKGLPLHLQIDTFDDFRENATPYHRAYCQIKVFCDKGAERKTRDEERRAAKRKLTVANGDPAFPGRRKIEEMYHLSCDRSEFYSMSDLLKPPILFTPTEDIDKINSMDLSFYANHNPLLEENNTIGNDSRDTDTTASPPPPKRMKTFPQHRVLVYTRQDSEEAFQPLHICPPTLAGLAKGIENKYSINIDSIRNVYKKNTKGITIQIDDDIVKHYSNEDVCILEVTKVNDELCDITLIEI